ncbi:hypothetical protein KIN20_027094 [Parelaphostrongylus tenuis]|uniref:Uncharacterized protein n=1 Tax=Parelaphostrongylus tenuis TaxID=148309 RepID=A0AAD5QYV1_PARTN|nr:hypothetical protein KIN20_011515 [Parelaphostrongylus tenuis]KAJ1366433.1 hypothetical protein KIN20_027094 [Parelaphostrongylus tenuis]
MPEPYTCFAGLPYRYNVEFNVRRGPLTKRARPPKHVYGSGVITSKAHALKEERKRQRDRERAKKLEQIETTTFSKEIVITPYKTKPPPAAPRVLEFVVFH